MDPNTDYSNATEIANTRHLQTIISDKEINRIKKFWLRFDKLENKLERCRIKITAFNKDCLRYSGETESDSDYYLGDEQIARKNRRREHLFTKLSEIKNNISYLRHEYESYLHTLGFILNDRTMDEVLFEFVNYGIL
jgi:predicted RNase H-like nuclease (RuvC/YqgF family)